MLCAGIARADGQRTGRTARARRRCRSRGPAAPSLPAGSDDERVERERALDRARLGAVGKAGEALGETDQRDARGVVGVAVVVRVDGALEPLRSIWSLRA